ncbi:alpha/beta hydrolase [Novosphingobium clariflavum]|uniref:Esterase/lipase family protein n=2 Tax=Novosphingobium clariflavum TaxID=2029884 RepID=A0ABV6S2C6_9SPHN|nr:alpha/beta hydrolase [Novosphingobium clariflavum]
MEVNEPAPRQLDMMRSAIARRAALAREPHPEGVRKPSLRLFLAELASLGRGKKKPIAVDKAQHPQPVMLLPGFGAHPNRMRPMADALAEAGHEVHEWGLGLNLGPNPQNFAFLMRRVGTLARQHKRPIALVGWSLGGLFAREIARREPDCVSRVITMGTPFSGDPRANNAWRAYQMVTGHSVSAPPIDCDFTAKPPVPTIALWSPRDGVIHPRSACGWPSERDRAVAIRCTHLGFASDPRVVAEVLRQLDAED